MVRSTALALLLLSSSAGAAPKTFAEQVAATKKAMEEANDETFVRIWSKMQAELSKDGITAASVRASTKWASVGYSFGVCRSRVRATDLANWYSAFDLLDFGGGEIAAAWKEEVRSMGDGSLSKGETQSDRVLTGLDNDDRARFCSIELEAARQLIAN